MNLGEEDMKIPGVEGIVGDEGILEFFFWNADIDMRKKIRDKPFFCGFFFFGLFEFFLGLLLIEINGDHDDVVVDDG